MGHGLVLVHRAEIAMADGLRPVAVKLLRPCIRLLRVDPPFDPDLCCAMVLPVGEEADAVAAEKDLVEVLFEMFADRIDAGQLRAHTSQQDDLADLVINAEIGATMSRAVGVN